MYHIHIISSAIITSRSDAEEQKYLSIVSSSSAAAAAAASAAEKVSKKKYYYYILGRQAPATVARAELPLKVEEGHMSIFSRTFRRLQS